MAHEKISGDTLFYFQKRTPADWHDVTVGKLTPEDIDSNFYTLKSMDIKDVTYNNGVLSFIKYDCEQSIDVNLNTSDYATKEEVNSTVNAAVSLLRDWVSDNLNSLSGQLSATTLELNKEISSAMTGINTLRDEVICALTSYNTEIKDFEEGVETVVNTLLEQFNQFKFEVNQKIHELEQQIPKTCYLTIESTDKEAGVTHGEAMYVRKSLVRALAEPNDGYMFVGWDNGGIRCADWQPELANPWYFTITKDTKITALFAKRIPLTVENDTPKGGIIELHYFNDDVVVSDSEIVYYVPEGYPITLTATPFEGFEFAGWSDGETEQEIQVSPTEIANIRATFRAID